MSANTIIRAARDSQNPYAQISRAIFEDERISWRAKGVIGYLLSRKDGWQVMVGDLQKRSTDGRDACYKALDELGTAGYLERHERREKGRIKGYEYVIHEVPTKDRAASWKAVSGKAVSGETVSGETVNGKTVSGKSATSNKGSNELLNEVKTEETQETDEGTSQTGQPLAASAVTEDQDQKTGSSADRAVAPDGANTASESTTGQTQVPKDLAPDRPKAPEQVPGPGGGPVEKPVENPSEKLLHSIFRSDKWLEMLEEDPTRARWSEIPVERIRELRLQAVEQAQASRGSFRTPLIPALDLELSRLGKPKPQSPTEQRRSTNDRIAAIVGGKT